MTSLQTAGAIEADEDVAARSCRQMRRFARSNVRIRGFLHCHGRFQGVLIKDISRGGMMIEGAFGVAPGDKIVMEMLSGRRVSAKIVWVISPRAGVMFDETLTNTDGLLPR